MKFFNLSSDAPLQFIKVGKSVAHFCSDKMFTHLQSPPGVFGLEELRSNCHGYREVAAQLVIAPGVPVGKKIPTTSNVLGRNHRHPSNIDCLSFVMSPLLALVLIVKRLLFFFFCYSR
jgi:hypothetical protein